MIFEHNLRLINRKRQIELLTTGLIKANWRDISVLELSKLSIDNPLLPIHFIKKLYRRGLIDYEYICKTGIYHIKTPYPEVIDLYEKLINNTQ